MRFIVTAPGIYVRLILLAICIANWPTAFAENATIRSVHVFVALADNQHQGIVPVPARLGNGLDPFHNLYWGAAAGVKTFFARSADWKLLECHDKPKPEVLERCIFKYRSDEVYLVADAYRRNVEYEVRIACSQAVGSSWSIPASSSSLPGASDNGHTH